MKFTEIESGALVAQGEALSNINKELRSVPAFKVIVQDCLREAIGKVAPGILISKVYINILKGANSRVSEPVGRLLDVVLECLQRGQAPNYAQSTYAVYDFPNSTDPRDIIQGLSIATVEEILRELLANFSSSYVAALKRYWTSGGNPNTGGAYPKLSRKSALSLCQSVLFARELDSLEAQGGITPQERAHISYTVQAGLSGKCYGVYIEGPNGRYVQQNSMFVVPQQELIDEQLTKTASGAVFLYSPNRGIEKFSSSLILHQALVSRLKFADSREELLQTLSIDEREGFSYGSDIRFLMVEANLFDRYTDLTLSKAFSDVAHYLERLSKTNAQLDERMADVESAQSLPEISLQAKNRQAKLLKLIEKNAWPDWLKKTSTTNQEVYVSLQQQLLEAEVNHHKTTDGIASMKDYARVAVEDFLSPSADERINPDNLFVNIVHTVPLANGQKIELSERKTLTQAFLQGGHDEAGQYQIKLEAFNNHPELTPANIMRTIQRFNIRANYNVALRSIYSQSEVFESLREVLGRKTALSMFSAILQKHVSPSAQDLVTRYNFGDVSIETLGVHLVIGTRALGSLLVYRRKGPDANRSTHVIHTPGFPTGQEWHEFADLKKLQLGLAWWAFEPKSWNFLKAQANAADIAEFDKVDRRFTGQRYLMLQEAWWSYIQLKGFVEDGPLKGAAQHQIRWDADQAEAATPQWFVKAKVADQRLLNRLNHDFKAIHHHAKEKLEIEPFKEFSRKLVANELNRYLSRTGAAAEINPDEVWVKFHADSKISLTELFIQWQLWRSDVNALVKFFSWISPEAANYVALKEELRTASFWTFTDQPINQLNGKIINELIDLKPADKYVTYLQDKFLNAPDIDLKINLFRKLKQNEMLTAALVQRAKNGLTQEQFNALNNLIDGLVKDVAGAPVGGARPEVGVYELTISGQRIEGGYVFSWIVNGRMESLVYLPGTFDGKDFFPYEELGARLKSSIAMRDNVLRRVKLEHQTVVEKEMQGLEKWISPNVPPSPSIYNSYKVKSFREEYRFMIERILSDVDHQTTSSAEAFWRDARILGEFALDIASMFIPPLGLALSVLRITQSVVQGIVAASQGLDEAANAHFASAWRGAIMLYVGKVAAIGTPVNPLALLSNIRDFADVVSAVTGVEVGISYVTAVAAPPDVINSTTRLIN
jgi:hypothetical protein